MAAPRIVVVGLGPGDPSLVGRGVFELLGSSSRRVFLRTSRHPSASVAAGAATCDDIYESAGSIQAVYRRIVERLVTTAEAGGPVVYAVPGSPLVAETTVELLRADPRVEVEIVPGMSFVDLAWARVGVDPFAVSPRLIDGQNFNVETAGEKGPWLVAQCDSEVVMSDIKLSIDEAQLVAAAGAGAGEPVKVTVLSRLGLPNESIATVPHTELDRVSADHLTTLWVPELAAPVAGELVRLDALIHTLRERCPWDRKQTHRTLAPHLIEEAYEVLEAIDELPSGAGAKQPADAGSHGPAQVVESDDSYIHFEEELGDLLIQVLFHATLAGESGRFTLADVATTVHDKLVARHPHVFGGVDADTPEAVAANWEQIKKTEKGRQSVFDGIPKGLPALIYAIKVGKKAASLGMDWTGADGPLEKVAEETAELRAAVGGVGAGSGGVADAGGSPPAGDEAIFDELGDLLFAVANAARHLGIDAEAALRHAAEKFRRRVGAVEALAEADGRALSDLDSAAIDRLWEKAKTAES